MLFVLLTIKWKIKKLLFIIIIIIIIVKKTKTIIKWKTKTI